MRVTGFDGAMLCFCLVKRKMWTLTNILDLDTIKHNIWEGHAQTGKIMTKSSAITKRVAITMAGLIIDYVFSSD